MLGRDRRDNPGGGMSSRSGKKAPRRGSNSLTMRGRMNQITANNRKTGETRLERSKGKPNSLASEREPRGLSTARFPVPSPNCVVNSNIGRFNSITDAEGNYIHCPGDLIDGRYEVTNCLLGAGAFSVVVEAFDRHSSTTVAVKIIRAGARFAKMADHEEKILQSLYQKDKYASNVVEVKSKVSWYGHECLIFERLSYSLFDVLKYSEFRGIRLDLVRCFAIQLLDTLQSLEDTDIIHCDLKPENVLLCKQYERAELNRLDTSIEIPRIKVIDFGSSCLSRNELHAYIQSRWYRAPEIILGIPCGKSVDMWSLGCILAELFSGIPLFPAGHNSMTQRTASHDMLIRFVRLLGAFPSSMVAQSTRLTRDHGKSQSFRRLRSVNLGDRLFTAELERNTSSRPAARNLAELLGHGNRLDYVYTQDEYRLFLDFLLNLLQYDPKERARPSAAKNHPFLTYSQKKYKDSNMGCSIAKEFNAFLDMFRCEQPEKIDPSFNGERPMTFHGNGIVSSTKQL